MEQLIDAPIGRHFELVLRKINNEEQAGRIAGPFIEPPFPTLRVSPIFLAPKKNSEFRLIHNLSHPSENSDIFVMTLQFRKPMQCGREIFKNGTTD
jgi:hypothetical protein